MPRGQRNRIRLIVPLVILAIVLVFALRMTSATPSWYRPPSANDPVVIQLADDVEYRLIEEAHRLRENNEPWTLRLREHQANAWLAARLPKWIAHERGMDWPSPLGTAQVHVTKHGIELAGDVATSTGRRFLVVRFAPQVNDDQLVLAINSVSLGRISLGSASAQRLLDYFAPEQKAELLASELGSALIAALEDGALVEPVVKLADGRRLILKGIALHDGAIDLTMVTEN